MRRLLWIGALIGVASLTAYADETPAKLDGLTAVPFQHVHISDIFWSPRIKVNRKATIEANLRQCEQTGRIKNFAVAAKRVNGKHEGALYNDSDVYKVIEGIAYTLADERDADLEKRTDAIIDQIAAAQQPDGYLNTYFTLVEPKNRWKNIAHGHELYCSGHLIEAAVAYYQATGKRTLLDVAIKLADHIDTTFGPGKKIDCPGHEELELALVKLYRATNEKRYLKLAQFFLDTRGHAEGRKLFGEYAQDHKPIREQTEVVGHAVRAMYLYCGMADVANVAGDKTLLKPLEAIWHDVIDRKMYITGGIGPSASNEGFTVPYDLPNDSAYAETCAAIGMALWNHRMFLMSGDGKYADILEREVYNGLISGVGLDGEHFFYVNPLASVGRHHRVEWFDCSCCPTNLVRYIPAMGERAFALRGNSVWTVLYMGNTASITLPEGKVSIKEETHYPWDGEIDLTLNPQKSFAFDLNLRIPGWCKGNPKITVNNKEIALPKVHEGYVTLKETWKAGDVVHLSLPMPVERVYADPHVKADVGRVALQRGPVVYCLEGADNPGPVRNLALPVKSTLDSEYRKDLLGGVTVIKGEALAISRDRDQKTGTEPAKIVAIPYCLWDNRKPGPMVVWLPETPELAEVPGEEGGVTANGAQVKSSHVYANDTLAELNDQTVPKSSKDHEIKRMTWWDHRGTTEWITYRWPASRKISHAAVYWFDDTGIGRCRAPAEWRLLWHDGKDWKPVVLQNGATYATQLDQFNKVRFDAVQTRALKLEVKLQEKFSGGVLKWTVSD